jgi:flagellar assembly protein FliH
LARKIFKAAETKRIGSKVLITPPPIAMRTKKPEAVEVVKEEGAELAAGLAVEEVEPGPSSEETRDKLLDEAKLVKDEAVKEAGQIKDEAEQAAFKVMQQKTVEVKKEAEKAKAEAERIIKEAETRAKKIEEETKKKGLVLIAEARNKAVSEGREEGYRKGEEEAKRLVERLHIILNKAIDKRKKIIDSTERQLIDLVLLISKKVVKVISEKARAVIIANVKESLKKVSRDTEITIRVNTKDLEITTKHKNSFIKMVEGLEKVTVEEDSRVDPGGCIIETSFGDIDARIQKQLGLMEERIRELLPI